MELVLDLNDSSVKKQIREQVLAILQNTLNDPKNAKKFKGIGNTGMIGNADKARPDLKKLTKYDDIDKTLNEINTKIDEIKKIDKDLSDDVKEFDNWFKKMDEGKDVVDDDIINSVNKLKNDILGLNELSKKTDTDLSKKITNIKDEIDRTNSISEDIDKVGASLINKYILSSKEDVGQYGSLLNGMDLPDDIVKNLTKVQN